MKELVGPYRIQSLLGQGGMGVVYLGIHDYLGREVAIKALAPELTQHPQFRERFFTEARVQASLQHTNIVSIYDLIEDRGSYFIIMEHVPGSTLETLLKDGVTKNWDVDHAIVLFRQVLAGLDYAHSKGVIHRDVKSSNILITSGDLIKLTDFGIALLIGDTRLTASQSTIGTPAYMSPEQILRPRSVDHRSDVYSAAIVLYEMLAGQPPFQAETEYEIKKLQIESPVPDVRFINPRVPAAIANVIMTGLRKAPDERFQSAGAFLRSLQTQVALTPSITASTPEAGANRPVLTEVGQVSKHLSRLLVWRSWAVVAAFVLLVGGSMAVLLFPKAEESSSQSQDAMEEVSSGRPIVVQESPLVVAGGGTPAEIQQPVSPLAATPALPLPQPRTRDFRPSVDPEPMEEAKEAAEVAEKTPEPEREKSSKQATNGPVESAAQAQRAEPPGLAERSIARKLTVTRVEIYPQLVTPGGRAVAVAHATVQPPFDQSANVHVRARVMMSLDEIAAPIIQVVTIPAGGGTWKLTIPVRIPKEAPSGGCYIDIELLEPMQQVKGSGRIGFTVQ